MPLAVHSRVMLFRVVGKPCRRLRGHPKSGCTVQLSSRVLLLAANMIPKAEHLRAAFFVAHFVLYRPWQLPP